MACLIALKLWRRGWLESARRWVSRTKRKSDQGELMVAGVFVVLVVMTLTMRALQMTNAHVYEYHDVRVLRQVGPNKWWMSKDDGDFLYEGCDDFPNSRVIWVGYVARKARWQEFGNCKSIERADLGFWGKRLEDGDAVAI